MRVGCGADRSSRFDRHGEISIAEAAVRGAPKARLTDAVTMLETPNAIPHEGQHQRLRIESNSIPSNLTKSRVTFASILSKTLPSSPTTTSRLSATVYFKGDEKAAGHNWQVMFFLLRIVFWLGVVCVLLPSGGSKLATPETRINATQAVTLASAAVSDMRGFCERQPDACKVGSKVAVAIGHKAEAGARTLYELVTATVSKTSTQPQKSAAEKPASKVVTVSIVDHGTLKPLDMAPAWHGRVPLPPRRELPTGRPSV